VDDEEVDLGRAGRGDEGAPAIAGRAFLAGARRPLVQQRRRPLEERHAGRGDGRRAAGPRRDPAVGRGAATGARRGAASPPAMPPSPAAPSTAGPVVRPPTPNAVAGGYECDPLPHPAARTIN